MLSLPPSLPLSLSLARSRSLFSGTLSRSLSTPHCLSASLSQSRSSLNARVTGSGLLNDAWAVEAPTDVAWPGGGGAGQFIQIYDWDTLVLYSGTQNVLRDRLELCTRFYPCNLVMTGTGDFSFMERRGNGSLACLRSSGCNLISVKNVTFLCDGNTANFPAVDVESAALELEAVKFADCSSLSDGGAVRCYGVGGTVNIESSVFYRSVSYGIGGAICAVGCSVYISNSSFQSCRCTDGGGAVSAAQFQCYGSDQAVKTLVNITHSRFERCGSESNGGAVLVSSSDASMTIISSEFTRCWSNMSGGAILATDKGRVQLFDSILHQNSGGLSGGAIALELTAIVEIAGSILSNNIANTGNGGAIYASDAHLVIRDSIASGNKAQNGAGGAFFWDGSIPPTLSERGKRIMGTNILFCNVGNTAIYGECLGSAYSRLEIQSVSSLIFAGLSFSIVVLKKDAYNQTILTDSESLVLAATAFNHDYQPDNYVGLSGNYIVSMVSGQALFSMIIKPSITKIDSTTNLAQFKTNPAIYFKGLDAETNQIMMSAIVSIPIQMGDSICPPGFILVLDQSRQYVNQTAFQGGCALCASGTYSVNPLAGTTTSTPSCFNCPSTATCNGGTDVRFSLGSWVVSLGMYILVACPAGHELVNSVGGVFSLSVQACIPCASNQYILNTNNSNISCQACPIGAVCDGVSLSSRVVGAVWTGDQNTGIYHLISCPPGYVMQSGTIDGQQCLLCPATYYCVGGSSPSTSCPVGTFAPAGTNASSFCMPVVYVAVVLSLPYTQDEFTATIQASLQQAISAASGVDSEYVTISSVSVKSRRASGPIIQVGLRSGRISYVVADIAKPETCILTEFQVLISLLSAYFCSQVSVNIALDSSGAATALSQKLDATLINAALTARGLPEVKYST